MPSASDLDRLAQQRMRALIGAGVIIAILAAVIVSLLRGSDPAPDAAPSAAASAAPTTIKPTPAPVASPPASGYVAPQRGTTLPDAGDFLQRTYRVSFPRTPQGAAAAASAMFQFLWRLDPAEAARAVDVYFAPAARAAARQHTVANAAWMREQIGLPATGELPPDASVAVQITGVQWKVLDSSNAYVSVNMRLDLLAGIGAPLHTVPAASTMHMRWHPAVRGGDWLVVQTPAEQMPQPQRADVGTAQFNAAGWMAIRPGG
ncbi:hypothetical protein ACQPYK_49080 (plasmid) [Streptosporangium sp. CA-135522]|uniref:hypothetical protein n=1 Tax=Streptosporangium sp. CA-135522 TaxID=3240072 RepID=UPI003D91C5B1